MRKGYNIPCIEVVIVRFSRDLMNFSADKKPTPWVQIIVALSLIPQLLHVTGSQPAARLRSMMNPLTAMADRIRIIKHEAVANWGRMERASEECGHGAGGPKSDIRLFFHTALTREAARSRPARLKWSHLLNTSATTLRRYSLNILKELGKV